MDSERPQKGLENPGYRVIDRSLFVAKLGFFLHPRNQEKVDNPADEKKSARAKPENSRERLSEIESMRSRKSENPKDVSDSFAVSGFSHGGRMPRIEWNTNYNPGTNFERVTKLQQHILDDMPMHIGKSEIAPLEAVSQSFVIKA